MDSLITQLTMIFLKRCVRNRRLLPPFLITKNESDNDLMSSRQVPLLPLWNSVPMNPVAAECDIRRGT